MNESVCGHRVLVTGATGAVGATVVQELRESGYTIRTLSLDDPRHELPADVDARVGDICNVDTVSAALEGVDVVIHLAALLHRFDKSAALDTEYDRINVGGTRNTVAAALRAGVTRFVLVSTVAVYGASPDLLSEDSPANPETTYAKTKLEAERIVLAARSADGSPIGVVLRLAAVYGARIKGNYERLVRQLAARRFVPLGTGANHRTLVYDRDVARAIVLAAQQSLAAGRVFNISDGEIHTVREIEAAICAALGRPTPRWRLPVRPVRAGAGLVEFASRVVGRHPPIARSTIDKYIEDVRVSGARARDQLGFRPRFDLLTGWREAVAGMRRMGAL